MTVKLAQVAIQLRIVRDENPRGKVRFNVFFNDNMIGIYHRNKVMDHPFVPTAHGKSMGLGVGPWQWRDMRVTSMNPDGLRRHRKESEVREAVATEIVRLLTRKSQRIITP